MDTHQRRLLLVLIIHAAIQLYRVHSSSLQSAKSVRLLPHGESRALKWVGIRSINFVLLCRCVCVCVCVCVRLPLA